MRTKILVLALICSLMLGSVLSGEKKGQVNFWQKLFTEPVETVYIIMKDGTRFKQTNHEEHFVYLNAGILEMALKKTSYKIKDIAIIIHNHRLEHEFSVGDWGFYRDIKKRGFNGHFLLYCHRTKEVYPIEEKGKSK